MTNMSITVAMEKLNDDVKHLKEIIELRFSGADKAAEIAQQRLDERLDSMNALREQINQERGLYLPRESFDSAQNLLSARITSLEMQSSRWGGSVWMLGLVMTAVVIVVDVALKIWFK